MFDKKELLDDLYEYWLLACQDIEKIKLWLPHLQVYDKIDNVYENHYDKFCKINLSSKEIVEILFSFFKNYTDKQTFELFKKIYKENKQNIGFMNFAFYNSLGDSFVNPENHEVHIAVYRTNYFNCISSAAHEFGHVIQAFENMNIVTINKHDSFVEIFSTFMEFLCVEFLYENIYPDKALNNFCYILDHRINEAQCMNKLTLFYHLKNNENVDIKKLIYKHGNNLSNAQIDKLIDETIAIQYKYIIGVLVAAKLFMLYKKDPEQTFNLIHQFNKIDYMLSEEDYFQKAKELGIIDSNGLKEFNDLILARKFGGNNGR